MKLPVPLKLIASLAPQLAESVVQLLASNSQFSRLFDQLNALQSSIENLQTDMSVVQNELKELARKINDTKSQQHINQKHMHKNQSNEHRKHDNRKYDSHKYDNRKHDSKKSQTKWSRNDQQSSSFNHHAKSSESNTTITDPHGNRIATRHDHQVPDTMALKSGASSTYNVRRCRVWGCKGMNEKDGYCKMHFIRYKKPTSETPKDIPVETQLKKESPLTDLSTVKPATKKATNKKTTSKKPATKKKTTKKTTTKKKIAKKSK